MKVKVIGPNMAELYVTLSTGNWVILISYETPVAAHSVGVGFFRTSEKFSSTTSRHINKWLGGAKAKVEDQDFFETLLVSRL